MSNLDSNPFADPEGSNPFAVRENKRALGGDGWTRLDGSLDRLSRGQGGGSRPGLGRGPAGREGRPWPLLWKLEVAFTRLSIVSIIEC